jgi:II/X family phage/plasmid replication protein
LIDTVRLVSGNISNELADYISNQSDKVIRERNGKKSILFTRDNLKGSFDSRIMLQLVQKLDVWIEQDRKSIKDPKEKIFDKLKDMEIENLSQFQESKSLEIRTSEMKALTDFKTVNMNHPQLKGKLSLSPEFLWHNFKIDTQFIEGDFQLKKYDWASNDLIMLRKTTGLTSKEVYKRYTRLERILWATHGTFKQKYELKTPAHLVVECSIPKLTLGYNGLWGPQQLGEILDNVLLPRIKQYYQIPEELWFPSFRFWQIKRLDFSMMYHLGEEKIAPLLHLLKTTPITGQVNEPDFYKSTGVQYVGSNYALTFYHKGPEQHKNKDFRRLRNKLTPEELSTYKAWCYGSLRIELSLRSKLLQDTFNMYPTNYIEMHDAYAKYFGFQDKKHYLQDTPQFKTGVFVFLFDELQSRYKPMQNAFNKYLSKVFRVNPDHYINKKLFRINSENEIRQIIKDSKYNQSLFDFYLAIKSRGYKEVYDSYDNRQTFHRKKKKLEELGISILTDKHADEADQSFYFSPRYDGISSLYDLNLNTLDEVSQYIKNYIKEKNI